MIGNISVFYINIFFITQLQVFGNLQEKLNESLRQFLCLYLKLKCLKVDN